MHQSLIVENVNEQGSDIYHFQARQLTLGDAAATFHCKGHFATGCPNSGSPLHHSALGPFSHLFNALFQPFGLAVARACKHAPWHCFKLIHDLLLKLLKRGGGFLFHFGLDHLPHILGHVQISAVFWPFLKQRHSCPIG